MNLEISSSGSGSSVTEQSGDGPRVAWSSSEVADFIPSLVILACLLVFEPSVCFFHISILRRFSEPIWTWLTSSTSSTTSTCPRVFRGYSRAGSISMLTVNRAGARTHFSSHPFGWCIPLWASKTLQRLQKTPTSAVHSSPSCTISTIWGRRSTAGRCSSAACR